MIFFIPECHICISRFKVDLSPRQNKLIYPFFLYLIVLISHLNAHLYV